MASKYESPITIEAAIQKIARRDYLLPSIQRNFTWSSDQICALFDSIMRNYPINSFMLWRVESADIREGFRFYTFLEKYVERFGDANPFFDTKGHGSFDAVIDGQQRLTSLYIGLKGSYAYKKHRRWWPKANDPEVLPPRKLYLGLAGALDPEENDDLLAYDFRFLTAEGAHRAIADSPGEWFEVGKILGLPSAATSDEAFEHVVSAIAEQGIVDHAYARRTLLRLYHAIRVDDVIHSYVETSQEIDHVLDIFIRTNKGGTPLSASDLLMSITAANWEDARERVDELVHQVRTDLGFSINRDFVMKASVMILDADVRLKVRNFDASSVAKIESSWPEISQCIVESFRLVRSFGLNDASLRAKNAVIPIVYYLFHKGRTGNEGSPRYVSINNPIRNREDRSNIRQWLLVSLLGQVFSFASDTLISNLRNTIRENLTAASGFPLVEIRARFIGTSKDITFDDEFIDRLLRTQISDPACYATLALLQPGLDIGQTLHIDHLHPAVSFQPRQLDMYPGQGDPELRAFYEDQENWNSISNLHLLSESENTSKGATPLRDWMEKQRGVTLVDPLIPPGTDLALESFPAFIEVRRANLREILTRQVGRS